ncbi:GRP family sugar transporter [Robiginitalea sediminis]|uniref:GRP family sugar transporter n=1 Tax=Robiginitalea sediminis TaxID=1982593 RepID=UPI000B4AD3FB|nr:GRP family sugar transporter [Robiginitalea sediminis]
MFIIDQYPLAVIFCIVTMLAWGSWANTQKLASPTWRFELFYWDYVFGILIFALLFALTAGSIGVEGRPFLEDLDQASLGNLSYAFLGGVLFNAANILLVAAITIAGMSVAFPVGIGLALAIGVVVNYLDSPVGDAGLLFTGVALVALAILLNARAYQRLSQTRNKVPAKGLLLAIVAGCLMGLFYKYVALSMFPDFSNPLPGKLSPYSAVFVFANGILVSNFVFNTLLMRKPIEGEPLNLKSYLQGHRKNHVMGILGGVIWCIGMSFSILASDKAGPAISYGLGQGATVVAALWGIYIWKEFRGAPKGVPAMLNLMLLVYAAGLSLIVLAR